MHAVLHRSEMARSVVVHSLKASNCKQFKVVKQIEIRESNICNLEMQNMHGSIPVRRILPGALFG